MDMFDEMVDALLVGQPAPMFEGKAYSKSFGGDGFGAVSLDDYKGKWVVLFFFPAAFTGICNSEVAAFAKRASEFAALDAELLGVSGDSQFVLKKLVESGEVGEVPFKLVSDSNHHIGWSYGVYNDDLGVNFRGLFIIDPEGKVRYQVIHEPIIGRSTDETLRVLNALTFGEPCPIDWHP